MTKTVATDSAKKVYTAPTLTIHGSVTEITQGSFVNAGDGVLGS